MFDSEHNPPNSERDDLLSGAEVSLITYYHEAFLGEEEPLDGKAIVLVSPWSNIKPGVLQAMSDDRYVLSIGPTAVMAKKVEEAIGASYSSALDRRISEQVKPGCVRVIAIHDCSKVRVYDWCPPASPFPPELFVAAAKTAAAFVEELIELPEWSLPKGESGQQIRDFQRYARRTYRAELRVDRRRELTDFLYDHFPIDELQPHLRRLDIAAAVNTVLASRWKDLN